MTGNSTVIAWDLFADGEWVGMAEGATVLDAINFAKTHLPNRVARGEQLSVHRWYGPLDPRNHEVSR